MNLKHKLSAWIYPLCITALLLLLFGAVFFFRPADPFEEPVLTLSEWKTDGQTISLPETFSHVAPRTPFTMTAQVEPESGGYLYLKTVYSPLKVYADDALIFQYGQPGSYPAFLLDPPTKTALVPLPDSGKTTTLTFEYLSPSQRTSVSFHPVLCGTSGAILKRLFSEMGFSLFFSIVLIALGTILLLIAFVVMHFEENGIAFFWLGLFSLCVGMWGLGECNLTGIFLDNPALLYLMAFIGLFSLPVPFIKFGLILLNLHHDRPLRLTCLVLEFSTAFSLTLQLLGIVSLSKAMYLFHLLIPLAFAIFGACILWEIIRFPNPMAKNFLLPISVVAVSSLLEVGNYYLFRLNVQKSFFFQLGILIFVVMISVLCGYFIRDTFILKAEHRQLAREISLMEKQAVIQKERYQSLLETAARTRQQRHDLKHHIAAIRVFLNQRDGEQLSAYLDRLSEEISPEPYQTLCQNEAVNAVALYYQSMAHKAGISSCSILLQIPEDGKTVSDPELCVIVGNLLENAVHACRGIEKPFIRMRSRYADGILTITMDNSCVPAAVVPDASAFPTGSHHGIGLNSIQAVAAKYGGGCRFSAENGVFYSSVYLYLS